MINEQMYKLVGFTARGVKAKLEAGKQEEFTEAESYFYYEMFKPFCKMATEILKECKENK